jgi:hypothetical protein
MHCSPMAAASVQTDASPSDETKASRLLQSPTTSAPPTISVEMTVTATGWRLIQARASAKREWFSSMKPASIPRLEG